MRRVRLRALLVTLVLVTTIPVAAFAAWVVSRSSRQQSAIIDRENVDQAHAIVVAVDQEIESTNAALNVLTLLEPIDAPDKTHFGEIAARLMPLHPSWESIRLIDRTMSVLASTGPEPKDAPVLDPDWIRGIIKSRAPAVSDVRRDPVHGDWIIGIGIPVIRGGQVRYVLAVRAYPRLFGDVLRRQGAPVNGVVTLIDREQHIVARTRNEDHYVGQLPTSDFAAHSRSGTEGSFRSVLLEGTPTYSAWSRSPLSGWTVGLGEPSAPIDGPIRQRLLALLAAGFGVAGVGLGLALLLGRRIVRAQRAVSTATEALAHGEPLPVFNSRIAEVHDIVQALRDAAAVLDERLRERNRAQAEADRTRAELLERETAARRAAEALNRAKDEFIATVSHELRTPLNAIYGWLAMLRSDALDDRGRAHALEVIDRNMRAQAQLVEDLLDMSRAIQGNIRIVPERLDLPRAVDAAIEALRPAADAKRLTVDVGRPDAPLTIAGDPRRLQQVFWNVLSNAVKFTPPDGRIAVRLAADHGDAVVTIADTGEGIDPAFLPYVFDRFRQENPTVTRSHAGLGLGLSLVHHLVEIHGGSVTAASDGKDRGATFVIRLPLAL